MRKLKIILSVVIPDIGGLIINTIPMVLLLSFTDFFAGETQGYPPLIITVFLLISLALLLIPFRLMLTFAQMLHMDLDRYGIFSIAIIGGLTGGTIFYFLILSHFYLDWSNLPDYALIGVIQSIAAQIIYFFIPDNWKLKLSD